MTIEEQVKEIVIMFNLHEMVGNKFSRRQEILYPRYYLINHLKQELGLTVSRIGKAVKMHHSTVIHAIKTVEVLEEINDPIYKELTYDIQEFIKLNPFKATKVLVKHNTYDLINRIMNCETLEDLQQLKKYINNAE